MPERTTTDPPPRLAPLPVERWDEQARAVLPTFLRRPELYLSGGPDDLPMPSVLGLLAHHVPLGEGWLAFNEILAKDTSLDPLLRELVILRVAWRTRSAYEWGQHIRIGRQAGLTTEQLHAVPAGPAAALWTPVERAVLTATDEIVDGFGVGDATWAELATTFDRSQLLALVFLAGTYLCFSVVCNSAGLRPEPPTEPVDAPALPDRDA